MKLKDIRSFCINLPDRPDKKAWSQSEFDKFGIKVEWYESVRTKPGKAGCRNAHVFLLSLAAWDFMPVAIYEDDCVFINDVDIVEKCFEQLPEDWDALYLGGSPQQPQQRYSENLFKIENTKVTHAIIWNPRKNGAVDFVLDNIDLIGDLAIDRFFAEVVQRKFNFFITYPMICTQKQSLGTDTCQRVDYSSILRNYNKYCK